MPAQTTVFAQMAFGVVGELADSGPVRAQPAVINSADATNNVFGRAFTSIGGQTPEGVRVVRAGNPDGVGVFAGFLVNPKASTTSGTSAGGTLAPTLTLPNESTAEFLDMGSIKVQLPAAANVGDNVIYANATGILSTIAPGVTQPVNTSFANAIVDRFDTAGAGIAVIKVTAVPTAPPAP